MEIVLLIMFPLAFLVVASLMSQWVITGVFSVLASIGDGLARMRF